MDIDCPGMYNCQDQATLPSDSSLCHTVSDNVYYHSHSYFISSSIKTIGTYRVIGYYPMQTLHD